MGDIAPFEFITKLEPIQSVLSVAVADSGRVLICHRGTPAGAKHTAVAGLWDGPANERLWEAPMSWPYACALAEDGVAYIGERTYNAGPSSVRVLDGERGRVVHTWTLPFDQLCSCALSPDGATLAVAGSGGDQLPRLYDTTDREAAPRKSMKGNKAGSMKQLSWSPEGTWLFSLAEKSHSNPEHTVAVRPPSKRKRRWHAVARDALALAGDRAVTLEPNGSVRLWSFDAPEPLASAPTDDVRMYPPGTLARIHGGEFIALAMSSKLYIFDAEDLALRRVWKLHGASAPYLSASPNGRYLTIRSGDGHRVFLARSQALIAPA